MKALQVVNRGRESYKKSLAYQENTLRAKVADKTLDDFILLVEHEPVYTTGRGVPPQELTGEFSEVPWVEVGRGGQATFHGHGQIVAYPIIDLADSGKEDVDVYLRNLEKSIILFLSKFSLEGFTREGLTGVWVNFPGLDIPKKVASIGVGAKKWVTYHGIAINIDVDLKYFQAISACGRGGDEITSYFGVRQRRR